MRAACFQILVGWIIALSGTALATADSPPSPTIRVAAISLVPKKFDLQGNADRLERKFREAREGGAAIAVAPEGVLEGYVVNEIIRGEQPAHKMKQVAIEIDGPMMQRFQSLARQLQMCLVFGFAERIGDDVFNAAVFIDQAGEIRGKYHKMQFAEGYDPAWWFNRLGKTSRAFDTPFGRCGLLICNDRWNPQLAQIPVLDGAQFLIIPSFGSRSKAQDEAVLSRGRENKVPVIEANVGVTLLVNQGRIIAVERNEEGITFGDIEIPPATRPDPQQRDAVEREFLAWRAEEMQRRLVKTRQKQAQSGRSNVRQPDAAVPARPATTADMILVEGKILTMDRQERITSALAIGDDRVLATGTDEEIQRLAGEKTQIVRLDGKTVIPGFIAAHCHAIGVARQALVQPHAELLSIAEVQAWIRERAKSLPPGTWIRVPRTDITRLGERRHPTPEELDAACSTHPVVFTAARKSALNSLGLKTIGVSEAGGLPEGQIVRAANGRVRLIAGANAHLSKFLPTPKHSADRLQSSLANVHRHYNAVGITSIFERAGKIEDYLLYRKMQQEGKLTVRMTQTFRSSFRSAEDVQAFTQRLGLKTGDGDHWVRVGPLKITVDGGIHWGNTYLREPYGNKRIRFYVHRDPAYRGDLNYSVPRMTELFREGHRLGWQWCCHVTGDAGVDAVLDALETVQREQPEIASRRFSLTHAYFPAVDAARRASRLGVCVDTQPSLYYKDSPAIAEVYGKDWAARFIGLGDWIRNGVPTAIAGDHMMGLDPNQAMNAYNPFLMLSVAVTRLNREGQVYGERQKVSRVAALRCLTSTPAFLAFEEEVKGSLEPGKLADLAVLDRDYLACPAGEIAQIKVLRTMVGGSFVETASK